jgi:DNA-binding transcriptional LysR family regulator
MELRLLRYFLAVVDTGSVTGAARAVHIAQPSLSRQIRTLERTLGLGLFNRGEGRLVLTSAGRHFLPIARDLVARADQAARAAAAIRDGAMSSITISSPGTTLTDVIAPFLATWGTDDPMPTVWERLPAQIYPSLETGADLAVGTAPPPGSLASLPVAALPVWAYVPPGHPWTSCSGVSLEELARENLLVLGPEQHSRQALDAALQENGVGLGTVIEFGTPEVAQAVAAAGRGAAVVSDDPRFGLVPVRITNRDRLLVIRLYAAWRRGHHATGAVKEIAQRLNAFCEARYNFPKRPK